MLNNSALSHAVLATDTADGESVLLLALGQSVESREETGMLLALSQSVIDEHETV